MLMRLLTKLHRAGYGEYLRSCRLYAVLLRSQYRAAYPGAYREWKKNQSPKTDDIHRD